MNILLSNASFTPGDDHAKFIQDRITNIEKNSGHLCQSLGAYTRQAARFRDRTDEFVVAVNQYAASETVNQTLQTGLQGFANCFSSIGDHRDAYVRRLEAHVVGMFSPIGAQCKDLKDEVKATFAASEREIGRKKQIDKLKTRNPRNRQKILLAETDLARASADVSRSLRTLEEHMDAFEIQKLSCTTGALRGFLRAELALHARELELLTKAYSFLTQVDEQQDLEDFRMTRGELEMAFRNAVRCPPKDQQGKTPLRDTLRSSLASLFTASGNASYSGLKTANSSENQSIAATETPSSPVSRTISLHGDPDDEVDNTDTLSIDDTSSSDQETVAPEPRIQRSISQPKFLASSFK